MKKNRFWLSYDLGLRGNYSVLYSWLDDIGAEDCGDSVATFLFDGDREAVAKVITKLTRKQGRMYLIGRNKEGHVTGKCISGRRKAPAWTGASNRLSEDHEEDA
jgi:hypothetical protein